MWRRSSDKTYKDKDGKEWSNIGTEYLLFDGDNLNYFTQHEDDNGELQLNMSSYGAVSGRGEGDGTFSYSEEKQAEKGTGPIPEGLYSINPQKIQSIMGKKDRLTNFDAAKNVGLGVFGKGSWPGGTYSWGYDRVWIEPASVTVIDPKTGNPVIRTNMSIHGGAVPGSAGCIDLHKNAEAFFSKLKQSKESFIRLNVLYSKKFTY